MKRGDWKKRVLLSLVSCTCLTGESYDDLHIDVEEAWSTERTAECGGRMIKAEQVSELCVDKLFLSLYFQLGNELGYIKI